jgi:undecaprenyl-diphosphatase
MSIEFTILDFIQENMRSSFGDVIMQVISALGNASAIWIALALGLTISPKYRTTGIILIIAIIIDGLLCNAILKPLVARIRPFDIKNSIELLISAPKDYSFPSGHTAISFTSAFALLFAKNKLWIPSIILATLIAFSRLYLYVHYPTDVLVGILLGIVIGYMANRIYKIIDKKTCKNE